MLYFPVIYKWAHSRQAAGELWLRSKETTFPDTTGLLWLSELYREEARTCSEEQRAEYERRARQAEVKYERQSRKAAEAKGLEEPPLTYGTKGR